MSVNKENTRAKRRQASSPPPTLSEMREGEHGILESIDLPERLRRRLMELGFLPGAAVTAAHSAPGGDPRVFRVDGSEVALRLETAACMRLRTAVSAAWGD